MYKVDHPWFCIDLTNRKAGRVVVCSSVFFFLHHQKAENSFAEITKAFAIGLDDNLRFSNGDGKLIIYYGYFLQTALYLRIR